MLILGKDLSICSYVFIIMKKNTLLYLDQYLVEKAKRENINISRVTEEALKIALNEKGPTTTKDLLQRIMNEDPENPLSNRYGERQFLPFQIESLKLNNIGPFEKFEASFSPNSLNIIYGQGGSGKSYILRSIMFAFGRKPKFYNLSSDGKITLKIFSNQESIELSDFKNLNNLTKGFRCWIADAPMNTLNAERISEILPELNKLGIQMILTVRNEDQIQNAPKGSKIISLKSYPHYR